MNVFRGYMAECLKHMGGRFLEVYPKGNKRAAEAKRPMAKFCGVSVDTVTGWLYRNDHLPRGEQYIRLMCFLELNGYKVIEAERLQQKLHNFIRLIGFGLISVTEAVEILGYNDPSVLFALLRGDRGASDEVGQKLWDMWRARKDQLDEAVEKASEEFRLNFSKAIVSPRPTPTTEESIPSGGNNCPKDGVVDIMQGLLRLLDSGALSNLTDADWVTLRNSSGMILRLSSHLSTISAKLVSPS